MENLHWEGRWTRTHTHTHTHRHTDTHTHGHTHTYIHTQTHTHTRTHTHTHTHTHGHTSAEQEGPRAFARDVKALPGAQLRANFASTQRTNAHIKHLTHRTLSNNQIESIIADIK